MNSPHAVFATGTHSRARSWNMFLKLFRPIVHPNQRFTSYLVMEAHLPKDADEHYWWTIVDIEERFDRPYYLEAGIHRANRIGLVRCANPWGGNWEDHPRYVYGPSTG